MVAFSTFDQIFKKIIFPMSLELGFPSFSTKYTGDGTDSSIFGDTTPINLIWMANRRTDSCIIFLVDKYVPQLYPNFFYVLHGLAYNDLDPHFILLHSRHHANEMLPMFRTQPYYISATIVLARISQNPCPHVPLGPTSNSNPSRHSGSN